LVVKLALRLLDTLATRSELITKKEKGRGGIRRFRKSMKAGNKEAEVFSLRRGAIH